MEGRGNVHPGYSHHCNVPTSTDPEIWGFIFSDRAIYKQLTYLRACPFPISERSGNGTEEDSTLTHTNTS